MSSTPIACLKSINLFQLDHKIVYFTRNKNSIDGRAFYGFYNPTINKRIGLFSENCGLFNGSRNGLGNEETEEWYTDIDFKWGSEMSIAVYDIIPGDQYYIIFRNYTDEIEYEISIPFHDSIVGYYLGFNDFRGFGLTISNIRIEDTDY